MYSLIKEVYRLWNCDLFLRRFCSYFNVLTIRCGFLYCITGLGVVTMGVLDWLAFANCCSLYSSFISYSIILTSYSLSLSWFYSSISVNCYYRSFSLYISPSSTPILLTKTSISISLLLCVYMSHEFCMSLLDDTCDKLILSDWVLDKDNISWPL